MDAFAIALNEVLVDTYHNILRVEEKALKKSGRIHLSIKEMHLIKQLERERTRVGRSARLPML